MVMNVNRHELMMGLHLRP